MRSGYRIHVVPPEMPAMEALETMAREDINQLPVVSNGRVEGIVTRAHLLQVVQARSDLNLPSLPKAA